jgi:flagellar hook-associated protein 2
MAGITGIGSGLDIDAIVGALVNAERAPKAAQLARLEKTTTTQISALGQLRGALSSFQTALKGLSDIGQFENRSAKSSNNTLLSVSAAKTAQAGSYSVKIESLASGSKTASRSLDGGFVTGSAGSLTVKLGADDAGIEVAIKAGASLSEVRDALNAGLKDSGISANLVTNPVDGKARLVMTSSNTGADKDVQISAGAGLESLEIGGAMLDKNAPDFADQSGVLESSANAVFSIDGLQLQSATNTITNAIPDVTFNLLAADKDKTVTVTVAQDRTGVTNNIKKFVEAYNSLIGTTNTLTGIIPVGDGKPPVTGGLVGDASVRNVLANMRSELTSPLGPDGVRMLTDLGITTQRDGTLKIDDAKLATALADNYDAVGVFFAGDEGLMKRLDKRVDSFAKSGGVLDQRVSGLQKTVSSIDEQRETLTRRVDQLQARLYSQFNAMDSLVAQLTTTSGWLSSALDNLPGVVRKDK